MPVWLATATPAGYTPEAGPGDLDLRFHRVAVDDNLDEGLDLDVMDEGNPAIQLVRVTADRNQDEEVR